MTTSKTWRCRKFHRPWVLECIQFRKMCKFGISVIRSEKCTTRLYNQLCIRFFLALQSSALSEISNQSFIYTMSTYVCARMSVYTNKHIKKIYRSFIADSDAAACCWILKFKQHYCGLESVRQTRGGVYCAGF